MKKRKDWESVHVPMTTQMYEKLKKDAAGVGLGVSTLLRMFVEKSYRSPNLEFKEPKQKPAKAG